MRIKDGWSPVGRGETLQDYYTVRQPSSNHSQYWTSRVDPDGRLREKISEQERVSYLENIDEELLFVRSLEPGRIVDFGCGPGWFLESLCRHWDKMGIEIAPHAVAELQRKGITVVDSTAEVPDAWADVVFCHHVIEHLLDPIHAIGEMHRMLQRGGWLIIGTPDDYRHAGLRVAVRQAVRRQLSATARRHPLQPVHAGEHAPLFAGPRVLYQDAALSVS